jgi:hypothetical protein
MERPMDVFKCTKEQCDALKAALLVLESKGIKAATITKTIMRVKAISPPRPTSDYIRKIMAGNISSPNCDGMQNLWDVVFDYYKDDLKRDVTPVEHANLELSVSDYFGIPSGKTDSIKEHICGKFNLYCYSEIFNASHKLPCAIVVGRLTISSGATGVIKVIENQKYDGRLGKEDNASENSSGICFQRGHTIYFIFKTGVRRTPKFYVFSKLLYNSDTENIQSMSGYLLKGSADGNYFHSPVYAVRAGAEPFACNILHPDAIDDKIIDALNSDLKVNHARRRINKANRS